MKQTEASLPVYQHEKRPAWGVAIMAWERGDKRGYLFEDGELRVISQPYYHFMKLSQADAASLSATFRQRLAQMDRAKTEGVLDPAKRSNATFTVEEQAQLLVAQYPGGFAGEAWSKRHRADAAKKKPLKRHRDAALANARTTLDPKRMARAITDNQHEELWKDISDLLGGTDLVTPRELKTLKGRLPHASRGLTIAFSAVLHTDGSEEANKNFADRFGAFVRELTQLVRAPSWALATSLLALYEPERYLSVHQGSLRQQTRWMHESSVRTNPNALDFDRANATARRLFEQLTQLGLEPRDLFDVYDFMRETTTPSAKKRLEVLRQSDLRGAVPGPEKDPNSAEKSDQEAA